MAEWDMTIIKGNKRYPYDKTRIRNAIIQAYNQICYPDFDEIDMLLDEIEDLIWTEAGEEREIAVEKVENLIMSVLYREVPAVAREFSSYKMNKERIKKNPTEIEKVLYTNPEVELENANKKATLTHIKNSYLAEIPSKEEFFKVFPQACVEAHNKGVVYAHDSAYSVRDLTNCELLNLDYLLQHGCKINNTWVDKPHDFRTACTIATQILTHVASCTYGGCTINLLALAKFVDVSRQKIRKKLAEFIDDSNVLDRLAARELEEEIRQGVQTFMYQNLTLCSSVGQAVFLTVSVYLNESPEYVDDLILVFKEMLKQRIAGIPNEDGIAENPNFPKIIYFLDEDTMRGGKYYEITKLCAECSAKRLVPDYMSVKKHLDLKGVVTPSMGKRNTIAHVKSFEPYQRVSV